MSDAGVTITLAVQPNILDFSEEQHMMVIVQVFQACNIKMWRNEAETSPSFPLLPSTAMPAVGQSATNKRAGEREKCVVYYQHLIWDCMWVINQFFWRLIFLLPYQQSLSPQPAQQQPVKKLLWSLLSLSLSPAFNSVVYMWKIWLYRLWFDRGCFPLECP